MEILLSNTPPPVTIDQLPKNVLKLVTSCRGFREIDDYLDIGHRQPSAEDYYRALKTQRKGSCRHRSVIFKGMMQEAYPDIPVQIIQNSNEYYSGTHMRVEIFYQGAWIACDLGGYDAESDLTYGFIQRRFRTLLQQSTQMTSLKVYIR